MTREAPSLAHTVTGVLAGAHSWYKFVPCNLKVSIINNETIQKYISWYTYHRERYTAGRTWSAIASLVVWIGL